MRCVTLELEHIGQNYDRRKAWQEKRFKRNDLRVDEYRKVFSTKSRRPWVAEIENGRRFIDAHTTYEKADKKGERGVMVVFHLFEGKTYEVRHCPDWKREERYFCRIHNGRIVKISKDDIYA